jgi:hypothetical protein
MIKGKYSVPLICISLLWAGMIGAISFLEAPVKFTAPSLTLQVGLDVGRHVFHAFNKVEIILCSFLICFAIIGKVLLHLRSLSFVVAALLILECVWLLPALDKRALAIIAGQSPEEASFHLWYILFDAIKLIVLILIGVIGIRSISKEHSV